MISASLFSQVLQHFPRGEFATLMKKHDSERYAKGFCSWTQFVSMLFCQMARADSLRTICNGLSCCLGRLTHLGMKSAPSRSTLSYANAHRPAALYEDLLWTVIERCRANGGLGHRKAGFRFKNRLLSLDSTTITLCLSLFPWADFRRAKGGVKAHVLIDHDDYMPAWALITTAKVHDVKVAQLLDLPRGSIVVMDRGYNDYGLFGSWTDQGVFFVTRLKENAVFRVVEKRRVPDRSNRILSDEVIELAGVRAETACPHLLRRVVVWDDRNETEIVLLTNHLDFAATTIAAIYKDRWEIELFFKALKQNLRIRTFVGTTPNALRIQIWTALIALVLLKWLHHLSKAGWSFANMATMLRLNLFTYRPLTDWLDNPYTTPPAVPQFVQLALPFAGLGQPPG